MLQYLLPIFITSQAMAYIPPSFYMVKMLAHKHADIKNGTFVHQISFYNKSGKLQKIFLETLTIDNGDQVSVRLADVDGTTLAHIKRSLSTDAHHPFLYDLIFVSHHEDLFAHLAAMGIPLKTERQLYMDKEGSLPYKPESKMILARFENRVAIVLGADTPHNTSDPQIWIEKDSFFPLKLFLPEISGGSLEYRVSGPQSYHIFYPHLLQIFIKNQLWAKIETINVKLEKPKMMNISKNKGEPNSETKTFIEQYFQWVR